MRRLTTLEPVRRWLAMAIRLGVLALLVLILAGLQSQRTHDDLTVVAVVDQSPSMRVFGATADFIDGVDGKVGVKDDARGLQRVVRDYLAVAADADRRPDDKFAMVVYDQRPTLLKRASHTVRMDDAPEVAVREGTNTAKAIEWAMASKSDAQNALRLVLVSDGNDTTGDALAAARAAAAAGVVIDVLPVDYRVGDEVMVEGVYTPMEAREGQTVAVRVVLRATKRSAGTLLLKHDGRVLDLNGPDREGLGLPVAPEAWADGQVGTDGAEQLAVAAGGRYVLAKQVDVPIGMAGANRFEAVFEPAKAKGGEGSEGSASNDTVAVNNRAESFTLVQGRGRVLLVDNVGGDSGLVLPQALSERQLNVDVVRPSGFPQDLTSLTRYDAVLFQNVPADQITGRQQVMLARYVNDLGGGFVMLGGPDSFGAGGWTNSVIDKQILPVACQIPTQTVLPSGAVVIVIDRSGSMGAAVGASGRSQMHLATEAAALAIGTLYNHDMIGVVGFDSFASWVVPLQKNTQPDATMKTVRSIQSGGGTNILAGLGAAYQALIENTTDLRESSIKHIILLSDGGSSGNYLPLINKLNRANITLSTVGVGDGHDETLLESLAEEAGGQYHPIDNPDDLPQVFIKEVRTVRKNLIREVNFVPQRVNTGSPVVSNLGAIPGLQGLVLTGPKYDRRVDMPLLGPEGEPLFAHWQVGLGKAAAFTSDATNRWATPWLGWGGYGDFWARTVRMVSRPSASREAELNATIEGDQLRVRLDSFGEGSVGSVSGKVLDPDGAIRDITLRQTGPGTFEADMPATQTGSYILNLFVQKENAGEGAATSFVAGGATRVPGAELRRFASNRQLLESIAAATGGRVLKPSDPAAAGLFGDAHRIASTSTRPLRWLLLPWLLGLFLLDVANRRIAWDHREIRGWLKKASSTQTRSAGETRETMRALKKRRSRVQDAAAAPVAETKFEAVSKKKGRGKPVAGGLRDAVGAADAASPAETSAKSTRRPKAKAQGEEPDANASTSSRLLAAKRRAREQKEP
ncbi:MAG: VWA domain-containing protein [Algisphaera sp.]